ncbi:hypothetical protein BN85400240 [Alteracholeplasma palmae J233]|uniref:Uncharacterized protein n=1 Tax=Alteracholeplasma palmae (strain ATCC 49389 / J233) TaxID=1318466 RepID=U4KQU1_ALTPJ|nr:hypothetical protein [Alteracholeplasma palmae]CCV63601.1 hypothetical protein BN85400240 [Alteracholeplasma palmae J233]
MAKIVKITKNESGVSQRNGIVNVECLFEKGYLENGQPCVILKTYNPNSINKGVSQILHINKDIAKRLIDIFKEELDV